MPKKYVLFDFDGVITDSFRIAYETNRMMCPHLTEDGYRKRFEGNINDWLGGPEAHTDACRHDVNFFAEYIPRFKAEAALVPGMDKVIAELAGKYTLIVISSTVTSPIEEFLESHGLMPHFAWVMGNDVHASKVEKIKMVFSKHGITAQDCVFITDTLGDMREASKTGVGSIGVSWGFHNDGTLKEGSPFRLVDKPQDLPGSVDDYFKAR
jgi:phosphoglycolate phosphatase